MADRRTLTLGPAAITVVANMVGTGVFSTTGLMVSMGAGSGDILVAWLIGGIIAFCGALCYGEVGANLPHSGGEYYYLSRLLHPSLGFISGVVSMVVGFAAPIAASALLVNLYIRSVFHWWPVPIMAAATVVSLAMFHAFDLHVGSRFQTIVTITKVLLIVAFIGGVLWASAGAEPADLLRIQPQFLLSSPFAIVLVFVSFAYSGWNAVAYIGTELKNPQKTLPRALLIGTTLVTVLYVLLNLSYLSAVPAADLAGVTEVGFVVAERLWGTAVADFIAMLIAVTLLCPISAMLMVGPRIAEAMARDGFLPHSLSKLNSIKVPSRAVVLQAALAAFIALVSSFGSLLIYIGFTLNIFAALTAIALFRLRREKRAHIRICWGYPVTPLVFLAFTLWMTIWSIREEPAATLLTGLLTFGTGLVLYLLRAKQARLIEEPVSGD